METSMTKDTGIRFDYLSNAGLYDKPALLRSIATYKWLERKVKRESNKEALCG